MAHLDENTETERKRYPFEKHNKTINDNTTRLLEDSKNVTGTDVAGDKRAEDVYVRNPVADPVNVTISGSPLTTPIIYNITSPVGANTEFTQVLSAGTKRFTIVSTLLQDVNVAFGVGESTAGPFITIPAGSSLDEDRLLLTAATTIYLATPGAGSVPIQILEWT